MNRGIRVRTECWHCISDSRVRSVDGSLATIPIISFLIIRTWGGPRMVPFQLVIVISSPSARPYEHASMVARTSVSWWLHWRREYYTHQLLGPSRPSPALQVDESFLEPWPWLWCGFRVFVWEFVMVVVAVKASRQMVEGQVVPSQIVHWPAETPRKVRVHPTRDVLSSPLWDGPII